MSDPKYKHVGTPEIRLIEECGELIQAICKAQRFGYFNFHPERPDTTNMDDVCREMDDVVEAIENLQVQMRASKAERYAESNKKCGE